MNKFSILITRPDHDLPNNYLYHWSSLIIDLARKKNFSIYDLKKKKARKKSFDSYIKKNNPYIIFLNGHGSSNSVAGFNDETLIEFGKDESLLKGRVIYSRSCGSARVLGYSCVDKGAKSFIGYLNKFVFFTDLDKTTKPLTDKVASYFLEPSNLVVRALLKGNSPSEAHMRSKKESLKKIRYLLSPQALKEERGLVQYLWRNMKSQVNIE